MFFFGKFNFTLLTFLLGFNPQFYHTDARSSSPAKTQSYNLNCAITSVIYFFKFTITLFAAN